MKIAIVGGGITGLSVSFYLNKYLRDAGVRDYSITLLESANRLGGKIETLQMNDCYIEKGPDSFLARKLAMLELVDELGMRDELVSTLPQAKTTYIWHNQQLMKMPQGVQLGIPGKIWPFLRTPLLTLPGKLRALFDFVNVGENLQSEDISLGELFCRRFGIELVERLVEPILAGIYAGDIWSLSARATFPQFLEWAAKDRSLMLGAYRATSVQHHKISTDTMQPSSVFLSFRHGLSQLIQALETSLRENQVNLITNTTVKRISKNQTYKLQLSGNQTLDAEHLVLTSPSHTWQSMFPEMAEIHPLSQMEHVSVAAVIFLYKKEDIVTRLNGAGFVVPKRAGKFMTACTWTSSKWPHVSGGESFLIRCYVGRRHQTTWLQLTGKQLILDVQNELREMTGITAIPYHVEVVNWIQAMPQYDVGHLKRVSDGELALHKFFPNVHVCGASLRGIGLPDCILQAKTTASLIASKYKLDSI
jgi:oxygen-dependent protoporphyrinogen oxidase